MVALQSVFNNSRGIPHALMPCSKTEQGHTVFIRLVQAMQVQLLCRGQWGLWGQGCSGKTEEEEERFE
ncbi:hypothetical protein V6N13_003330 [Hibiscus sabdariffa]